MTSVTILLIAVVSFSLRLAIASRRTQQHGRRHVVPEPPPPQPRTHESLATVTDGELVRLVGRARGTTIASALTGRACVAYLSRAQVWHSRKIPQLIEDLRDVKGTFVLEVPDGEIIVDGTFVIEMRTARITPTSDAVGHALLAAHKLERFARSSDYEEALIEDGDEVAVSGIVVRDAVEAAGYRELPRQRRRFIAHARHPVTVALP